MITWGETAERARPRETKRVWGDTESLSSEAGWLAWSQAGLFLAALCPKLCSGVRPRDKSLHEGWARAEGNESEDTNCSQFCNWSYREGDATRSSLLPTQDHLQITGFGRYKGGNVINIKDVNEAKWGLFIPSDKHGFTVVISCRHLREALDPQKVVGHVLVHRLLSVLVEGWHHWFHGGC